MTTKYHTPTSQKNSVVNDVTIDRRMFVLIADCNHLTPADEAKMDNLLTPGIRRVPTIEEIIAGNMPGFIGPQKRRERMEVPDSWDSEEPTNSALDEIEAEQLA